VCTALLLPPLPPPPLVSAATVSSVYEGTTDMDPLTAMISHHLLASSSGVQV
jgi:hypothetical protein